WLTGWSWQGDAGMTGGLGEPGPVGLSYPYLPEPEFGDMGVDPLTGEPLPQWSWETAALAETSAWEPFTQEQQAGGTAGTRGHDGTMAGLQQDTETVTVMEARLRREFTDHFDTLVTQASGLLRPASLLGSDEETERLRQAQQRAVLQIAEEYGRTGNHAWAAVVADQLAQAAPGIRSDGQGLPGGVPQGTAATPARRTNVPQRIHDRVASAVQRAAVRTGVPVDRTGPLTDFFVAAAARTWHDDWPVDDLVAVVIADARWAQPASAGLFDALTQPAHRHVLRAISVNRALGSVLRLRPQHLEVLSGSPALWGALSALPTYHLERYENRPEYLDDLLATDADGRRPLVEAIESGSRAYTRLHEIVGLATRLNRDFPHILALAGTGPAGDIVAALPDLAAVVAAAPLESVRAFAHEWTLARSLFWNARTPAPAAVDYAALFGNRKLRARLQLHSDQTWLVVRSPKLLAAVTQNLDLLNVLDRSPRLVDVLEDLPAVTERLAGSPALLNAAADNAAVADWLSRDPHHFDAVPDAGLLKALRAATEPEPAVAVARPGEDDDLSRLRTALPNLDLVLTAAPELTAVLRRDAALVQTLLDHPDLLSEPHEYRRLLSPDVERLRSLVRPGSPLLAPHLLRAALRHRNLRDWFLWYREAGAYPVGSPQRALGAAAQADPLVGEMVASQSAVSEAITNSGEMMDFALLLGPWQVRRNDERFFTHLWVAGLFDVLRRQPDPAQLMDVLFRNDGALIKLAGHDRRVMDALDPRAVAVLHAHPTVPAELASRPPFVLSAVHWRRFFGSAELIAGLSRNETLLSLLASAPEVLREAIARPGFVAAMENPDFQEAVSAVAAQRRAQNAKKKNKNKAWVRKLEEAVTTHGGGTGLSPEGVTLTANAARWGMIWRSPEEVIRQTIEELPARTEELRARYLLVLDRVRRNPPLLAAARRSVALGAALFTNQELLETLEVRPRLLERLEDEATSLLVAIYARPRLTAALRTNDYLYGYVMHEPSAVSVLIAYPVFAQDLYVNPELARLYAFSLDTYNRARRDPALERLARVTPDVARVLADGMPAATVLMRSRGLTARLSALLTDGAEGTTVIRAVVSGLSTAQAVADDLALTETLRELPALARAVADHPGTFTDVAQFRRFMGQTELLRELGRYPDRSDVVLRSAELVETAVQNPAVVAALAADDGLAALLERPSSGPVLHQLLRAHPHLATRLAVSAEQGDHSLRTALGAVRGLAQAMNEHLSVVRDIIESPWLEQALLRAHGLVGHAVAGSALWRAAHAAREFADALTPPLVRRLDGREGLLRQITERPQDVAGIPAAELRRLLTNTGLTRFLTEQRPFAERFLATPAWRAQALAEPDFTDTLRRLARQPEGLRPYLEDPTGDLLTAAVRPATGAGRTGRTAPDGTRGDAAGSARAPQGTRARAAGPRTAGTRAPVSVWAEALASVPEAADLLLSPSAAEAAGELGRNPELLPLLLGAPAVLENLTGEPAAWRDYTFGTFLASGEDRPETFETDFHHWLAGLGAVLETDYHTRVRDMAQRVWDRARTLRDAARAEEAARVAERVAAFQPHRPETWEYSGRLVYARHVRAEHLSPGQSRVLAEVADARRRPRESEVRAHQALHVHLDGGSGGASFAYVLAGDGRVDTLVYAISSVRQGNKYQWDGHGSRYVDGPLEIDAVRNEPALVTSTTLVREAAERAAREATQRKGKDTTRSAAGERRPAGDAGTQPLDPELDRLAAALAQYHAAVLAQDTARPSRDKRAQAREQARTAGALKTAQQTLRDLGLDPDHVTRPDATETTGRPAAGRDEALIELAGDEPAPAPSDAPRTGRSKRRKPGRGGNAQETAAVAEGTTTGQPAGPARPATLPASAVGRLEAALAETDIPAEARLAVRRTLFAAAQRSGWHDAWPARTLTEMMVADVRWLDEANAEAVTRVLQPDAVHLVERALRVDGLTDLLFAHPDMPEVLASSPSFLDRLEVMLEEYGGDAERLVDNPDYLDAFLMKHPTRGREIVEAIESEVVWAKDLLLYPSIPHLLNGQIDLIRVVMDAPYRTLAMLLDVAPEAGYALVRAERPVHQALSLSEDWALISALVAVTRDLAPVPVDYRRLFAHRELRRALHAHADQAYVLVRVPALLDLAMRDTSVLDALAADPLLIDVLSDVPGFAARLARSKELIATAVGNPAVAERLSHDPRAFDGVPDEMLATALRDAGPPPPVAGPEGESADPALEVVLAEPGATAAVWQEEELLEVLRSTPRLLAYPHEYRRLFSPGSHEVRELVADGNEVLLRPGVLTAVLRHGTLRSEIASGGGDDVLERIGRALDRAPWLTTSLITNPAVAERAVMMSGLEAAAATLARTRSRLGHDDRLIAVINHSGVPDMMNRLSGTRTLETVLLRHDGALLRLLSRNAHAAVAVGKRQLANLAPYGKLVDEIAARFGTPLSVQHWQRLFDTPELLDALARPDHALALDLLLSAPEAFAEAVARPDFAARLNDGTLDAHFARVSEQRRTRKKKSSRAWVTALLDVVRSVGEAVLYPEGIAHQRGDDWLVSSLSKPHDEAMRDLDTRNPDLGPLEHQWVRHVSEAVRADRWLMDLAHGREALAVGLYRNTELLETLRARPALARLFEDHSENVLLLLVSSESFTRALRDNDYLYRLFLTDQHTRARIIGTPEAIPHYVGNPELSRLLLFAYDTYYFKLPEESDADLVHQSPDAARVMADGGPVADALLAEPALRRLLADEAVDDVGRTVIRAVVSSAEMVRAVARHPDLLDTLADVPWLAEGLADNPGLLPDAAGYAALLSNEALMHAFTTHPGQVREVLSDQELTRTAMASPAVVAALESDEHLARLLAHRPSVHRLLREQPSVVVDLARGGHVLRRALTSVRDLADTLADFPGTIAELRRAPWLLDALLRSHALLRHAVERSPVWAAALAGRNIAEALTPQVVRRLATRATFLTVLADQARAVGAMAGEDLRRLLANADLTHFLNGQPVFAARFLRTPSWYEQALRVPDLTTTLRALASDADGFRALAEDPSPEPLLRALSTAAGPARTSAAPAQRRPAQDTGRDRSGAARKQGARPARGSVWAQALASVPEAADLLLGPAGGEVVAALGGAPELLPLLIAAPSVAEDLAQRPSSWPEYAFGTYLRGEDRALESFESDHQNWLDRAGVVLTGDFHGRVAEAARPVWTRAREEREARRAEEATRTAERLASFAPHRSDTWELSGRLVYATHLHPDRLAPEQLRVLRRVAGGELRPRESDVRANRALHVHLDGGSGGASFAYVLAPDGRVDVLVYALSTARQGNMYKWEGHSGRYVNGPLDIDAVRNHPALVASVALVREAADRAEAQTRAAAGKGKRKDAGTAATAPAARSALAADPEVVRLVDALTRYHAALAEERAAQSSHNTRTLPRARAKLEETRGTLRELGLDPETYGEPPLTLDAATLDGRAADPVQEHRGPAARTVADVAADTRRPRPAVDVRPLLDGTGNVVGLDLGDGAHEGPANGTRLLDTPDGFVLRFAYDPAPPPAEPAVLARRDGARVRLSPDQFADLAAQHRIDDRPLWLVTEDGARYGLDLARTVAERTGVPVWSHSGRVDLVPDSFGALRIRTVTEADGSRPEGHWMRVEPGDTQPGAAARDTAGPDPYVRSVTGERFHFRTLLMTPFAEPGTGRVIGHMSLSPREMARAESAFRALPGTTSFSAGRAGDTDPGLTGTNPWTDGAPRHYLVAHGPEGRATVRLHTRDGRAVEFTGEETGALLRRHTAFRAFWSGAVRRADSAVVTVICYAGRPGSLVETPYIQSLADSLGLTVTGPTGIVGISTSGGVHITPFHGRAGWLTALPRRTRTTFRDGELVDVPDEEAAAAAGPEGEEDVLRLADTPPSSEAGELARAVLEPRPAVVRGLGALLDPGPVAEAAPATGPAPQEEREAEGTGPAAEDLQQARDRRDAELLFAPPAHATSPGFRHGVGDETFAFADDRLPAAVREGIGALLEEASREPAARALAEYVDTLGSAEFLRQAVADRVVLTLGLPDGRAAVTVRLRLGDWTQLTDPRGAPLAGPAAGDAVRVLDHGRRPLDWRETASSRRTVRHGLDAAIALPFSQVLALVPPVAQAGAALRALLVGSGRTSDSTVSSTVGTTRTVRPSADRSVVFRHDVGIDLVVQRRGRTAQRWRTVVEDSLLVRHPREALRELPRPEGVQYATSALLREQAGAADGGTAALRRAPHDPAAVREERAPRPAVVGEPVTLPRFSWLESVTGAADYRAAVFAAVDPSHDDPFSPAFERLDAFARVRTLLAGLPQATAGGYRSVPVSSVTGRPDAVRVRASFHNPRVVADLDGPSRADIEDVHVAEVGAPSTQWDASTTGVSDALALAATAAGLPLPLPSLGYVRSVHFSRPGQQAGSVELHRLRFTDEPTTVVEFDVNVETRGLGGRGGPETWLTARVRMLATDADRLGARPEGPTASAVSRTATDPEAVARTAPGRGLRLPAAFRDWLPPASRVGHMDRSDAERVRARTLRLVHHHFPGFLAVSDPWGDVPAPRTETLPARPGAAPAAHQVRNQLALDELLSESGLARVMHRMTGPGHSVTLTRTSTNGTERVKVTLRATLDPEGFRHVRSHRGQMDVYHGTYFDLTSSATRQWKLAAGLELPLGGLLTGPGEATDGAGGRFAPGVSWSGSLTESGGFVAGGASGGGSLWLSEFGGPVHVEVTAERVGDPAAGPAVLDPVPVRTALLVPEDLVMEDDGTGRLVRTLALESRPDGQGGAHRTPRTGEDGPARTWTPPEERLPQDILHLVRTDHLTAHVTDLLRRAGVPALDPLEEAALETAVEGLAPRVRDFTGAAYPLWTRPVGTSSLGLRQWAEVSVRAVPGPLTALGESEHAYRYDHTLGTAVVRHTETDDSLSLYAGLGTSLTLGSDPAGADPLEVNVADLNRAGPEFSRPRHSGLPGDRAASGLSDRTDVTTGPHVWADAPVTFHVTVRIRAEHRVGLLGRLGSRRAATREVHGEPVRAPGLALMQREAAVTRGLRPAPAEQPAGRAPADPLPMAPSNVLRGDGFDQAALLAVPDLRPFVSRLLPRVRELLSREHADAVEAELWKTAAHQGTKALLETMLTGLPLLVPHRDQFRTTTARLTLTARLLNPRALGQEPGGHVLDGRNLRAVERTGDADAGLGHIEYPAVIDSDAPQRAASGSSPLTGQTSSPGGQLRTGRQDSTSLRHAVRPWTTEFDVEVTARLDVHWALSGASPAIGLGLPLVGRHDRHPLGTEVLPGSLRLGHPEEVTRPQPDPAGPRPAAMVRHEAPVEYTREGLPLTPDLLRDGFVGTVGDLNALRAAAEDLFTGRGRLTGMSPAANSWQGGPFVLQSKIAAIFSPPHLSRWFLDLAARGTLREPVTVPGTSNDARGSLEISADVHGLRETGDPLPGTFAQEAQRSLRGTSGATGSGARVAGTRSALAAVDEDDRSGGRRFSRVEATSITWHIVHRPVTGRPRAVDVTVSDEAAVFYVPTDALDALLGLGTDVPADRSPSAQAKGKGRQDAQEEVREEAAGPARHTPEEALIRQEYADAVLELTRAEAALDAANAHRSTGASAAAVRRAEAARERLAKALVAVDALGELPVVEPVSDAELRARPRLPGGAATGTWPAAEPAAARPGSPAPAPMSVPAPADTRRDDGPGEPVPTATVAETLPDTAPDARDVLTGQRATTPAHRDPEPAGDDTAQAGQGTAQAAQDTAPSGHDTAQTGQDPVQADPAEAEAVPEHPWYVDHGVLGHASVTGTGDFDAAAAGDWARRVADGLPASERVLAPEVTAALRTLLGTTGRHAWEELLAHGVTLAARGRLVWLRPVLVDLVPADQRQGADGVREYGVRFATTAGSREHVREQNMGVDAATLVGFTTASAVASAMLLGLPQLRAESSAKSTDVLRRNVIAGRTLFIGANRPFTAGLRVRVFVDGAERTPDVTVPRGLRVEFPAEYAGPGTPRPDLTVPAENRREGTVRDGTDRPVLNAIDMTPVVAALHGSLRRSGLDAVTAARVMTQARELLNERTGRTRSRWWLTTGDTSGRIEVPLFPGRSFGARITVRAEIDSLQFAGVTENVQVRDDLGRGVARGTGRSGSGSAGISFGYNTYGFSMPVTEGSALPAVRGLLPLLGVSFDRGAGSGLTVTSQNLNHTVLNAREDQARYRSRLRVSVDVRTEGRRRVEPVSEVVEAELGVAWRDGRGAAAFEQRTLGAVRTPGLLPDSPSVRPSPVTTHPHVMALLRESGTEPLRAGALPERMAPGRVRTPHSDEPPALAARRGQGFAMALAMPGSQLVLEHLLWALRQYAEPAGPGPVQRAARRAGLGGPADAEWAALEAELGLHFGRPALEADLPSVLAGVSHTVTMGGRRYRLTAKAILGDRLDGSSYPMLVNARAARTETVTGKQGSEWSVAAGGGGGVLIPVGEGKRIRVGGITLRGAFERSRDEDFTAAHTGYRRTETEGPVHEHVYDTVYELSVRPVVPQRDRPAETWWLDRPGELLTQVVVPEQHAPNENGPEKPLDAAAVAATGRVSFRRDWPAAGARQVDFAHGGTAGIYPAFLVVPELTRLAADGYARLAGLPARWLSDPANWPEELGELTQPAALAARLGALTGPDGYEAVLPARDGWRYSVRLRLRAYAPVDLGQTRGETEIEQYAQAADKYKRDDSTSWHLGLSLSAGPQIGVGALAGGGSGDQHDGSAVLAAVPQAGGEHHDEGHHDEGAHGDVVTHQSGGQEHGGSGARVVALAQVQAKAGWGGGRGRLAGVVEISRATYKGTPHLVRTSPVFEVTVTRARGSRQQESVRYLRVERGLDLLVPDRRMADLLPPAAEAGAPASAPRTAPEDPAGAAAERPPADGAQRQAPASDADVTGTPAADPAGQPARAAEAAVPQAPADGQAVAERAADGGPARAHLLGRPLPGAVHPEVLRADDVLREITTRLESQGVLGRRGAARDQLVRALRSTFSSDALQSQYTALTGTGVARWFPVDGPFGSTRYVWVRVTAEVAEPHSHRSRPEIKFTLRSEGITEDVTGHERSLAADAGVGVRTRFGNHDAHAGFEAEAVMAMSSAREHEAARQVLDIARANTNNTDRGEEFEHRLAVRIELRTATRPPMALAAPVDAVRQSARWVAGLVRGEAPQPVPPARTGVWYDDGLGEGRTVPAEVRLLVPSHLTVPADRPVPPVVVPDAAAVTPRWAAPARSVPQLPAALTDFLHPWDVPAARVVQRWAKAAAYQPVREPDLTRERAWEVPGLDPLDMAGMRYDHHTSTPMLRANVARLLEHRYEVPVGDRTVTVGFELTAARVVGPAEGVAFKARRYQQDHFSPKSEESRSRGAVVSVGPEAGGMADGHRLYERATVDVYARSTEDKQGFEAGETRETNREATRPYRHYKFDVTVVVRPVKGARRELRIPVPGGLYAMLPLSGVHLAGGLEQALPHLFPDLSEPQTAPEPSAAPGPESTTPESAASQSAAQSVPETAAATEPATAAPRTGTAPAADTAPAVHHDWVHPADRRFVVESDPGETLWHYSASRPEDVFREGFRANDTALMRVLDWADDAPPRSPFTFTSRTPELRHLRQRYRYEIVASRNPDPTGVDVNATAARMSRQADLPHEEAVAFTIGIAPRAVVRVYDYETRRTGRWNAQTQQVEWAPGEVAGEPVGRGEVRTDRWLPYGAPRGWEPRPTEAFVFVPDADGGRPLVRRPVASGERTDVGYAWVLTDRGARAGEALQLTRRLHLVPDGVTEAELDHLRHTVTEAVHDVVNAPGHRLPAQQPDRVPGRAAQGPMLSVRVEFTDDAASAHQVVTVRAGRPRGEAMTQNVWYASAHPAAFVHEVLHGLGVRDDYADLRVLLTPGGRVEQRLPQGRSSLMGTVGNAPLPDFRVTEDHLRQIAEVWAPYAHLGAGPAAAPPAWPAQADTAPAARRAPDEADAARGGATPAARQ
ncbi:hypothetical protein ACFQMH_31840, partial [Streptomyces viridiviolaceus]